MGRYDDRPLASHNTLFLNRGDGTYAEIAHFSGVAASDWTWSAVFLDVDLDGYEDLLIGNGHAFDILDLDTMERIDAMRRSRRPTTQQVRQSLQLFPPLRVPNYAFRNLGNTRFEEVGTAWGFDSMQVSHGMALADLDGDGDLDVVVNCLQEGALIYRNNAEGSRVAVRLRGQSPNTRGIGSRLRFTGGPVEQSQQMIAGGRYVSGDDAIRVFATGTKNRGMTLEVTWPNGQSAVIDGVEPDRLYEIQEPSIEQYRSSLRTRTGSTSTVPLENNRNGNQEQNDHAWFKDISDWLTGGGHHEVSYDDFARQSLMNRRYSQLGPGIAWVDLNGDGWEDIVMGNGKGASLAVWLNEGGQSFRRATSATDSNETNPGRPAGPESLPESGTTNRIRTRTASGTKARTSAMEWAPDDLTGLALGLSGMGGTRILIGVADYEDPDSNGCAVFQWGGNESGLEPVIENLPSSVGPLALADVNGNGRLDLVVGGRLRKGRLPEPVSSFLYLATESGAWEPDEVNRAVLEKIGLVSGAVWSDLDGDGWPDLILACEWGPIRVLRNDRGRLIDVTQEWGLEPHTGWWNGVATGDFDGDGRLDIVATNWGLNSLYRADESNPFRVYYDDLNGNNYLDWIEARTDQLSGREVPRRNLVVLGSIFPFLRQFYATHREFSKTDVAGLLRARYSKAGQHSINQLASQVFLNRDGRFEVIPLPDEAQWAPAFGIAVADFDGDGQQDLILSQNFFATVPDQPRLDAGRGLVLRGNGDGTFKALSGGESGLLIYGEQRGLAVADFDQDGRMDVVVTQNGGRPRLFRNQVSRPGLQVRVKGSPNNPLGIGVRVRLMGNRQAFGPAQEIQSGSGYWSQNSTQLIFAQPDEADQLQVTWPGGRVSRVTIPTGTKILQVTPDP